MATQKFSLPLIIPGQSLKHLTINEAMTRLDAAIQLSVSGTLQTPTSDETIGQCYFIGAEPTGEFAQHAGDIATNTQGGWRFFTPKPGWICWDEVQEEICTFRGGEWINLIADDPTSKRVNTVLITSGTGNYSAPVGVRSLTIEVQGGGGGGAGAVTRSSNEFVGAGGGGGGGFTTVTLASLEIAKSFTYSIGQGGDGGSAEVDAPVGARNGQNGEPSSFTNETLNLRAEGGKGAIEREASTGNNEFLGGYGGQSTGGELIIPGQNGSGGITSANYYMIGNGLGGNSHYGNGGAFGNGDGSQGTGYGGGGGGAGMIPGLSLNRKGGAGAHGCIRITEYF